MFKFTIKGPDSSGVSIVGFEQGNGGLVIIAKLLFSKF